MAVGKKTQLNPYLTFPGNCREALEFYKEATNGQVENMPFEGSPVDVPDHYKQHVLHSTLRFGHAVVMASDSMPGQEIVFGNGNYISIAAESLQLAERYFRKLSAGGHILMPFEKTFWGGVFGMFIDKFGVGWMVNFEEQS
ncbi:MAG: VOC family protein [Bacteroidetes bacterium]|nr:VOC family protein [Bacteroidota bacterium]